MPTEVALVCCPDYDRERTHAAVKRAVDLLGGMETFIRPGETVLIKPNLLKARPPEAAVTTHPEVVRAVIRLVKNAGGIALVGDSPGLGELRVVAQKAGILDIIHQEGAELVDLDEVIEVRNQGRFQRFEIARRVRDADAVINLPKLKTHGMTSLTGAVKNLFGCVPGKRKVQWHFNTGVNHDLFMTMLAELCALIKPRLSIMDAIVGMEGNGPGSGDPRWIGAVLAGRDPVSVDVIAGSIVGVPPGQLPIIQAAAAAGIGEARLDRIRVIGDAMDGVRISSFLLPPQAHLEWNLPEWARHSLKNALTSRPVLNNRLCVHCGICQSHCPQRAIDEVNGKLEIKYRDCIRCFCCQEFCPQGAITVGKGWALRVMP